MRRTVLWVPISAKFTHFDIVKDNIFLKDKNNCGECGNKCPGTNECVEGKCSEFGFEK